MNRAVIPINFKDNPSFILTTMHNYLYQLGSEQHNTTNDTLSQSYANILQQCNLYQKPRNQYCILKLVTTLLDLCENTISESQSINNNHHQTAPHQNTSGFSSGTAATFVTNNSYSNPYMNNNRTNAESQRTKSDRRHLINKMNEKALSDNEFMGNAASFGNDISGSVWWWCLNELGLSVTQHTIIYLQFTH